MAGLTVLIIYVLEGGQCAIRRHASAPSRGYKVFRYAMTLAFPPGGQDVRIGRHSVAARALIFSRMLASVEALPVVVILARLEIPFKPGPILTSVLSELWQTLQLFSKTSLPALASPFFLGIKAGSGEDHGSGQQQRD